MNDHTDKELLEKLKLKMAISNFENTKELNSTLKNNKKERARNSCPKEKWGIFIMKRKVIATVCASFIIISGLVLATNIENIKKDDRGLGDGIGTAIKNGYIAMPNKEFTNIDDVNTKVTIEDFLMDDVNLSIQLLFKFDNSIKDVVNIDNVNSIELTDLIIRDEQNRIIYGGNNEERFSSYCKENNLNYIFGDYNSNYMNCGVNCFNVSHDTQNNMIKIMYNINAQKFPKSKKLYFSFKKVAMQEFKGTEELQNNIIVNGNWEVIVDVPEKMYNRTEEYYKVVSCDNPDFDVYTAKVTDTGFEIGLIISNIERPELDEEKYQRYIDLSMKNTREKISEEELREFRELKDWYCDFLYLNYPISTSDYSLKSERVNNSYVENDYLEKFKCTNSPGRNAINKFLEEDKLNFYETFSMTGYNATNRIKVILYYYERPVIIELEKS